MPALGWRIASSSASLPNLPPIAERSGPVDFFPSPSLWQELHFGPLLDRKTARPRRASPVSASSLRTGWSGCLFFPAKGGRGFFARALFTGLRLAVANSAAPVPPPARTLP